VQAKQADESKNMALTNAQRVTRLEKRAEELGFWTVRRAIPLDHWLFNGEPISHGDLWPTREGVAAFSHGEVPVPADWPLDDARLELDLGGEGLVRISYASGADEAFGLDPNHRRFRLKEPRFSVAADCVARLPFGVPNRDARLSRARLVWLESHLAEFTLLLQQVMEMAQVLEGHEVIDPLLSAAEESLYTLRWPTATQAYIARVAPGRELKRVWQLPAGIAEEPAGLDETQRASVSSALACLVSRLKTLRERYPQTGALALTGHAHLDLAWLWPLAETRRKAVRTLSSVIGLMDRHPGFRFNQSTAQLYAFLETDDPALFTQIKERVASGQWEPIGGMWVEPDTNMPTGESFVRQLLYGQRYFEQTFGRRHTVCWLPDCFGFSPALPQILHLAGIDSFFTIKVNWSETNQMPFDLFWWEGLDGSRVLAHTFKNPAGGYNSKTDLIAVIETWRNFTGKHLNPESLLCFGHGDGGGGPTEEMLTRQRQLSDFPVVPSLRPVNVADWFASTGDRVAANPELPTWVGEIYLELHRGTLTSQGRTKFLHRRAERALITAETLSSIATLLGGPLVPSLEEHWRALLRNQFHDILPGSSIREVCEQTEAELAGVIAAGLAMVDDQLSAIADTLATSDGGAGILVINPDLSARPLRLASEAALPGGQAVEGGSVLAGGATVPGLSAMVVAAASPPSGLRVDTRWLENARLRIDMNEDGSLASVYDKQAEREILADRGNQIWAYVDKPREWDAWDVEEDYRRQGEEVTATSPLQIAEAGPHRAAIQVVRRFRDSEIVQTVQLWANSARLDFKTDIDWHDRRILLKARFPLAIHTDHATFECAHGVIRRPTHRNTSWDQARFEVAAHRFVDMSEHGYGVALLNDGKYGHHAVGNELGLTLLRSPVYPDPLADEGRQSFTYSLYPHTAHWLGGGVLAEAEDLNQPLLCRPVASGAGTTWTAVGIGGITLGLSGLKPAEDGNGLIFRTYEPAGASGKADITLAEGWSLSDEVDLLEDRQGPAGLRFSPFKLRSWRINRTS
jgi:alpha-mannosidase